MRYNETATIIRYMCLQRSNEKYFPVTEFSGALRPQEFQLAIFKPSSEFFLLKKFKNLFIKNLRPEFSIYYKAHLYFLYFAILIV